jgi:hypothetical protein
MGWEAVIRLLWRRRMSMSSVRHDLSHSLTFSASCGECMKEVWSCVGYYHDGAGGWEKQLCHVRRK